MAEGLGSGLVGLYLRNVLSGECYLSLGISLLLGGAASPGSAKSQMPEDQEYRKQENIVNTHRKKGSKCSQIT